jgi:hypothetical protein
MQRADQRRRGVAPEAVEHQAELLTVEFAGDVGSQIRPADQHMLATGGAHLVGGLVAPHHIERLESA